MTEPTLPVAPFPPLGRLAVQRLILCAGLFVAWVAYLALLVFTRSDAPEWGPRLLSRPQAQVSQLDIVGTITDPATGEVMVERVLYPSSGGEPVKKLRVTNLADAGISKPGTYLLLLVPRDEASYEIARLPLSPGLDRRLVDRPQAYLATPDLLAQHGQVKKP